MSNLEIIRLAGRLYIGTSNTLSLKKQSGENPFRLIHNPSWLLVPKRVLVNFMQLNKLNKTQTRNSSYGNGSGGFA